MLRQRQEEEERIEAERRKRVIVTIDLLGRKVRRGCHFSVVILLLVLYTFAVLYDAGSCFIISTDVEVVTRYSVEVRS